MNRRTVLSAIALAVIPLLAHSQTPPAGEWKPLFNGKDLSGWETFFGTPEVSVDYPGVEKTPEGAYTRMAGKDGDPLKIFSVVENDGGPVLRVSGQVFGTLKTTQDHSNYHLRMQVKWGELKWGKMQTRRRDSGILFHTTGDYGFNGDEKAWLPSFELQIQEQDFGDLYVLQYKADGTATTGTVTATNGTGRGYIYDPAGKALTFLQARPIGNRMARSEDMEKPHGQWNDVELIAFGTEAAYVVNGKVVNRIFNLRDMEDKPKSAGPIALQCEGSELFYRKIEIMPIDKIPPQYKAMALAAAQ